MSIRLLPVLLVIAAGMINAQVAGSDDVIRIGPGVTRPRILHKIEPEYSPDARADHIQGTVIFQLVVNDKGHPTNISVISPLGFGLDERAQAAIEKWEFAPGMKDGKPVKILATVEVSFRFPQLWFDEKAEHQRSSFNVALQTLQGHDAKAMDRAVKSVQDLSKQRFPAAMYMVGLWEISGDHVDKDPADGLAMIQKAAAKNYGPALYEVAVRQIEGRDLPADVEKGMDGMRQAAMLGSPQAQFYLGNRYEKGSGVPQEPDRARRYFRLCATKGISLCEYRLGRLLFDTADRPERDYVQAVAWFQLASEQGLAEAKDIAATESARLTTAQASWVKGLKPQLIRK